MDESRGQKDLSQAEWKVMKIMWDLNKAMAREVYTVAGKEHGWSPTTVKTLLRRLVDKGYLTTTKIGNGFVYRPARSAIAILRSAADMLLENTTRSATRPLLAHMVDASPLSEDDLDALQRLIDEKKKSLSRRRGAKSDRALKNKE